MTSRKILEIPKLIDLALGTPDIRVVNFSLLHALLHVMVKEIFDIEEMQIELIQKFDGKFEAILHRNSVPSEDVTNNFTNLSFKVKNYQETEGFPLQQSEYNTGIYNSTENLQNIKHENLRETIGFSKDNILVWDKNVSKPKISKKDKKSISDTESKGKRKESSPVNYLSDCPFQVSGAASDESSDSQNLMKIKSVVKIDNKLEEEDELGRHIAGQDSKIDKFIFDGEVRPSELKEAVKCVRFPITEIKREQSDDDLVLTGTSNNAKTLRFPTGDDSNRQRAGEDEETDSGRNRLRAGKGSDDDLEGIRDSEVYLLQAVDSIQILTKQLADRMGVVEDSVKKVRNTLMNFNYEMTKNLENFNVMMEGIKNASASNELDTTAGTSIKTTEVQAILKDVKHLKHDACDFKKQMKAVLNHIMTNIKIHKELEKKIIYPTEQSRHQHEYFDAKFMDMMEKFKDTNRQIKILEKQICNLNSDIEELLVNKKEATTSSLNLMDLHAELNEVKRYSANVMKELEKVQQERQAYKQLMDSIKKDIETLSASKLDKEEIDELLTEKADCTLLDQKLSVDDYNINRKRLENYVKNGVDRVADLENNLKGKIQSFGDLLRDKLDANELRLFRDEIDKKLHLLNDKIAGMKGSSGAEVKGETEAAATKTSLMSNVECLSCQKNVVMKMKQNEKVSLLNNCYVTKSIKPQLTYQLDLMRHEEKDLPMSRNLHHFESMMKKIKVTGKQKRYCGGSHTLVTNEDKVAAGSTTAGVREGAKIIANMKCIT